MAIYQYNIEFIPRKSILDKYGEIPNRLYIDHDALKDHLEKDNLESNYDFDDAFTIRWWEERKILFSEIEPTIISFEKPVEWLKDSADLRRYGNEATNDLTFVLTEDGLIEDFGCRINISILDKNFIDNIFTLAKQIDCLLIDRKGNLFEPTYDKLFENIKQSNSFKFVSNPTDFFDKLSSGQIKPE